MKMVKSNRKRRVSSISQKSPKKNLHENQSILSKLSSLRELLHGSAYEEIDLSNCLRECYYNVQLAAEKLITGQFVSSSKSGPKSDYCNGMSERSDRSDSTQSQHSPCTKKSRLVTDESLSFASSISSVEVGKPESHTSITKVELSSQKLTKEKVTHRTSGGLTKPSGSAQVCKTIKHSSSSSCGVQAKSDHVLLLCQRWIVGISTSRRGSINYHESVTLSTSIAPPSRSRKGANIVRFRGSNVEGTLDKKLSSMLAPLMRIHKNQQHDNGSDESKAGPLIRVVARGLMEDPLLNIGMEVPLELTIYILQPVNFFALFQDSNDGVKSAKSSLFFQGAKISNSGSSLSNTAFNLLQWAQYGNAPKFESDSEVSTSEPMKSDNDSTSFHGSEDEEEDIALFSYEGQEDENAPSWVGDVYAQSSEKEGENSSNQIPEESDPLSMNKKGVFLKSYQRQALHWMMQRETVGNEKNSEKFRDQLQLLAELSADDRSLHAFESQAFDSSAPNGIDGIQCSVGPVLVSDSVAASSSTLDGTIDPAVHPLWQRRFLWDKSNKNDEGVVFSFYVNELLQIASIKAPNPPRECCGGILADAMGLGKTVMLIALMSKDLDKRSAADAVADGKRGHVPDGSNSEPIFLDSDDDGLVKKKTGSVITARNTNGSALSTTLVVAPLSLLAQWEEEINTKSSLSCLAYYGDHARKLSTSQIAGVDVLLTTYGMLQSEYSQKSNKGHRLLLIQFHRVILDEAHAIKNPKTGASKACCALKAGFRWCVTGTPISNSLQDVYGLLKFLKHEPWCEATFWKKAIKDVKSSEAGEDNNVDTLSISLGRVRRLLEPLLLRRTKDTLAADGEPILKLPPVDTQIIPVVLSEKERLFYNALLTKSQDIFDGFIKSGTASNSWFAIFSLLQRLRQACDHLALTVKSRLDDKLRDSLGFQEEGGVNNNVSANRECIIDEKSISPNDKFLTDLLESSNQSESSNEYSQKVVETLTQCIEEDGCLQDECAICLEIPQSHNLAVTPCHHIFCKSCLFDNIAQAGQSGTGHCPLCSKEISQESLICTQVEENAAYRNKGKSVNANSDKTLDFKAILHTAMKGKCSSKMETVFQELDEVWRKDPGSKVLIFSQFLGMLDLFQSQMQLRQIGYFRLDGSMSQSVRRKTLESFSSFNTSSSKDSLERETNDKIQRGCVLLASMKACGVGMNLTMASTVFIIDPWWSFALEKQCVNRIHRIGQDADVVRVRKFVVSDSVEEKIVKMQERKMGMANDVLSDKSSGIDGSLNPSLDDLKAIFGR